MANMIAHGFTVEGMVELIGAELVKCDTDIRRTEGGRSDPHHAHGPAGDQMTRPDMAKAPTPIADSLSAAECVLLFCIGTGVDWRKVVAAGTAQHMLIRGLIERAGSDFNLTEQGRAVLETAMMRAASSSR
jgi:hypothetical protein